MKLNPDCIRDILLTVEDTCTFNCYWEYKKGNAQNIYLQKYNHDEIIYHIRQCSLSGFLNGVDYYDDGALIDVGDLTPTGHQFLADIRSDTNWNKTKEIAKNIGSESLSALKQIATGVVTSLIQNQFGQS